MTRCNYTKQSDQRNLAKHNLSLSEFSDDLFRRDELCTSRCYKTKYSGIHCLVFRHNDDQFFMVRRSYHFDEVYEAWIMQQPIEQTMKTMIDAAGELRELTEQEWDETTRFISPNQWNLIPYERRPVYIILDPDVAALTRNLEYRTAKINALLREAFKDGVK